MIHIDIVEDDNRLANGLKHRLSKVGDFRVRSIFPNAESAIDGMAASPPQILIVDLNLPGMSGVGLIAQLKPVHPNVHFLVLTMYEDTGLIFDALKAGATGYLLKRASMQELTDAIRQILAGGAPMSPSIARQVVQSFQAVTSAVQEAGLTAREQEVLDQLSRGALYKEIASELSVSIDTVRSHIRRIYEKLQVHSRSQAVAKYLRER